jgi:hypothetical protein
MEYYIDLTKSRPHVGKFTPQRLANTLDSFGLKSVKELVGHYDRPVFETREEAELFLKFYLKKLDGLENKKICKSRELPCMLYKRRYMIQTLLGLKNQTYRDYEKPWKPGQLFNLHDQVFFLTVRLLSLTETDEGFKYSFDLP